MEAKQTPLIDLLESVPRDAVLVVEHDQFSSSFSPVGRLCHEAAAELRRLHAQAAQDEALLRQALEALESSDWYMEQLELIVYSRDDTGTHDARAKVQSTIAALRERLGEKA